MHLLLHDSAYTDRLAAFLRSVGQRPVIAGPAQVGLDDATERAELEVYLRVWRVLHPECDVELVA